MVSAVNLRLNAADRSYFALLKKEVHALAVGAGFAAKRLAEIDIVVAEMVSNLAKHAGGGEVLVKLVERDGIQGIELLSVDKGPGIADIKGMIQDGASSKNTLGHGLGAINRLADVFQIYSQKGWGTLVLARLFQEEEKLPRSKQVADIKSLVLPKPGETECGDGFYVKQTREYIKLFLGDGLGHGKEAALATQKAIEAFKLCPDDSPAEVLRFINQSVRRTRGLVATVAVFSRRERLWRFCGVGNISTRIQGPIVAKNHNSYNGIVGLNMPGTIKDQVIPHETGQCLVMCSDGLKSKWELGKFPGILRYDLSLLNAALFREYTRNTDDLSIASCKLNV